MGVTDGAAHFDAPHPVGIVGVLSQHVGRYGATERGPATPGVELVRRYEQRLPGSDVDIYPGPEFPVIFVNVGPLGSAELRNGILLGRQPTPQFRVRRLAVSAGSLPGCFSDGSSAFAAIFIRAGSIWQYPRGFFTRYC